MYLYRGSFKVRACETNITFSEEVVSCVFFSRGRKGEASRHTKCEPFFKIVWTRCTESAQRAFQKNWLLSLILNSGCWVPGRLSFTLGMMEAHVFWALPHALRRVGASVGVCLWESRLVLSSNWATGIKQLHSGSSTQVLPSYHFSEPAWEYWKLNPVNRKKC